MSALTSLPGIGPVLCEISFFYRDAVKAMLRGA